MFMCNLNLNRSCLCDLSAVMKATAVDVARKLKTGLAKESRLIPNMHLNGFTINVDGNVPSHAFDAKTRCFDKSHMIVHKKPARSETICNAQSIRTGEVRHNNDVYASIAEMRQRIPYFRSHFQRRD
jgi:hypothetical protein